jgi:hypothetical protein
MLCRKARWAAFLRYAAAPVVRSFWSFSFPTQPAGLRANDRVADRAVRRGRRRHSWQPTDIASTGGLVPEMAEAVVAKSFRQGRLSKAAAYTIVSIFSEVQHLMIGAWRQAIMIVRPTKGSPRSEVKLGNGISLAVISVSDFARRCRRLARHLCPGRFRSACWRCFSPSGAASPAFENNQLDPLRRLRTQSTGGRRGSHRCGRHPTGRCGRSGPGVLVDPGADAGRVHLERQGRYRGGSLTGATGNVAAWGTSGAGLSAAGSVHWRAETASLRGAFSPTARCGAPLKAPSKRGKVMRWTACHLEPAPRPDHKEKGRRHRGQATD